MLLLTAFLADKHTAGAAKDPKPEGHHTPERLTAAAVPLRIDAVPAPGFFPAVKPQRVAEDASHKDRTHHSADDGLHDVGIFLCLRLRVRSTRAQVQGSSGIWKEWGVAACHPCAGTKGARRDLRARKGARVGAGHSTVVRRAPLAARPGRQRGAPPQAVVIIVVRSALWNGRGAARGGRRRARTVGVSGHEAHACRIVGRDRSGAEAGGQQEQECAHFVDLEGCGFSQLGLRGADGFEFVVLISNSRYPGIMMGGIRFSSNLALMASSSAGR